MKVGQNSSYTASENLVFNGASFNLFPVFGRPSESILVQIKNFVGIKVPFDGATMTSVQCLGFMRHTVLFISRMHARRCTVAMLFSEFTVSLFCCL